MILILLLLLTQPVDDSVIREVALRNPHFALTLIHLREFDLQGEMTIYQTPVKIDIEKTLSGDADYKVWYMAEAKRLNRLMQVGELKELIYTVTVSKSQVVIKSDSEQVVIDRQTGKVEWA